MTPRPDVPISCTLSQQDRTQQVAHIRNLHHALRDVRREPLKLNLIYAPEAAGQIREVVAVESTCCSFFDFDFSEDDCAVRLTITSLDRAQDAAQLLFDQFAPRNPVASR